MAVPIKTVKNRIGVGNYNIPIMGDDVRSASEGIKMQQWYQKQR
jgi:hypothetical protein